METTIGTVDVNAVVEMSDGTIRCIVFSHKVVATHGDVHVEGDGDLVDVLDDCKFSQPERSQCVEGEYVLDEKDGERAFLGYFINKDSFTPAFLEELAMECS